MEKLNIGAKVAGYEREGQTFSDMTKMGGKYPLKIKIKQVNP